MAKSGPPRAKLPGGMSAPVHIVEALSLVVELETEAYAAIGSVTRVSPSDLVSDALALWLRAWIERHGPLPYSPEERRAYVAQLAGKFQADLRDQLNQH